MALWLISEAACCEYGRVWALDVNENLDMRGASVHHGSVPFDTMQCGTLI